MQKTSEFEVGFGPGMVLAFCVAAALLAGFSFNENMARFYGVTGLLTMAYIAYKNWNWFTPENLMPEKPQRRDVLWSAGFVLGGMILGAFVGYASVVDKLDWQGLSLLETIWDLKWCTFGFGLAGLGLSGLIAPSWYEGPTF